MEKKETLSIAAVQFNAHQTDKKLNLKNMEKFIQAAAEAGADIISFPEICITGYGFLSSFENKTELLELAEIIPDGDSVQELQQCADRCKITILFGLLEKDQADNLYNTYVCLTPEGNITKYRKIHAFENDHISSGDEFVLFDINGWKCGILICFDNNLPENPRVYALKGCEILFAPHQTCGFNMEVDGMGLIDPELYKNRKTRKAELEAEFSGPKGRAWLMKWLPSRAYDNNMYYVFTNGVGEDDGGIRTGNGMIIDPHGSIIAESDSFESDMIIAKATKDTLKRTLGKMHMTTRKPGLYSDLTDSHAALVNAKTAREKLIQDISNNSN